MEYFDWLICQGLCPGGHDSLRACKGQRSFQPGHGDFFLGGEEMTAREDGTKSVQSGKLH